ncbi:MAG: 50S ribosomal protein L24 [Pseudomonadota bacterium]
MRKIKKGDEVVVLAGKDKGKRGAVKSVVSDSYVVVENVNVAKRHVRPNPMRGVAGGIVEKEMPIHASNVALFNSATGKADRVGFRVLEDGRKVRFFKSNNELVDA